MNEFVYTYTELNSRRRHRPKGLRTEVWRVTPPSTPGKWILKVAFRLYFSKIVDMARNYMSRGSVGGAEPKPLPSTHPGHNKLTLDHLLGHVYSSQKCSCILMWLWYEGVVCCRCCWQSAVCDATLCHRVTLKRCQVAVLSRSSSLPMSLSGSVAHLSSKHSRLTQWSTTTPRCHGYCWPTSTCLCCSSTVSTPVSVWQTSGTAPTLTRRRPSTRHPSRNRPVMQPSRQAKCIVVQLSSTAALMKTNRHRTAEWSSGTRWAATKLRNSPFNTYSWLTDWLTVQLYSVVFRRNASCTSNALWLALASYDNAVHV